MKNEMKKATMGRGRMSQTITLKKKYIIHENSNVIFFISYIKHLCDSQLFKLWPLNNSLATQRVHCWI